MTVRVFLNPRCNHGRGLAGWRRVAAGLEGRLRRFSVEEIPSPAGLASRVSAAIEGGDRVLVAGGGDGTVNLLLNAIMACGNPPGVVLGAVGLGSSNDFHKPFRKEDSIRGIPVKVDWAGAAPRDVIRVEHEGGNGARGARYCLINASVGITALGNSIFNCPEGFLRALRRVSVNAAITAAALKAALDYRDIPCRMAVDDGEPAAFRVSNLGVIKSRHFAGGLRYDTEIGPADGKLGINLYVDLSLAERIAALIGLRRGRFSRRPKASCWRGERLSLAGDRPFELEMDGEVVRANAARFQVVPGAVRCCR